VYEALLRTAARFSTYAGLVVQALRTQLNPTALETFGALAPFLVRVEDVGEWPGSQIYGDLKATRFLYTLGPEVLDILVATTSDLFAWVNPMLPEDLHLLRADLSPVLGSIAQEDGAWVELDDAERAEWTRIVPPAAAAAVRFDAQPPVTAGGDWLPFRYRDFYDIPRAIVVSWQGVTYLLECLFDDALDDYLPRFDVYRLPASAVPHADERSWVGLHERGEVIGTVDAAGVVFDETKRAFLHASVFEAVRPPGA